MTNTKRSKERLDKLLLVQLPDASRQQVQSWIMQGLVFVDGVSITKPGTLISCEAKIECTAQTPKFVSRAGFKLERALDDFSIDVTGFVVLDAGISTGGFTDCLLQRGVKKVFGIDVGYGQVHEKVRTDERLVLMERTNLRHVTHKVLGEFVDLVTLDLSFISVTKVLDAVYAVLKPGGKLVVLIKPQFEAQRHEIGRGGIVRDDEIRASIVERTVSAIEERNFKKQGLIDSPITGATGNKEFLAYFERVTMDNPVSTHSDL